MYMNKKFYKILLIILVILNSCTSNINKDDILRIANSINFDSMNEFDRINRIVIDDSEKINIVLDKEELEIIETILKYRNITGGTLLVNQTIQLGIGYGNFSEAAEYTIKNLKIDNILKNNFITNNSLPQKINIETVFSIKHIWLDQFINENEVTIENYDLKIKENIPDLNATISFSRAGYNSTKSESIIYMGINFGPLSGTGGLYYLKKRNNEWRISKYYLRWNS